MNKHLVLPHSLGANRRRNAGATFAIHATTGAISTARLYHGAVVPILLV